MLGTVGSAKRTLYLAIRHAGYPIDAVLEADCPIPFKPLAVVWLLVVDLVSEQNMMEKLHMRTFVHLANHVEVVGC